MARTIHGRRTSSDNDGPADQACSVARNHGGEVYAVPRDGGELVVTVTLPALAAHADGP